MRSQRNAETDRNFKNILLPDNPVLIIAETGTSHNGDPIKASELIHAAAASGADCVKTQIVFADEIIHPETGYVDLPGGSIRLYDRFLELEQNFEFYLRFKEEVESLGMLFLASPFGMKSLEYIRRLECDALKIASPELNHFPLLGAAADTDKILLLSTGVSLNQDILRALEITGTERTVLLHCITAYPAPEEEYNLRLVKTTADNFGVKTGVSDHSRDPLIVPAVSTAVGGCCIEKHFTLNNDGNGLDDPIALSPARFAEMTTEVRRIRQLPPDERLQSVHSRFGKTRVEAVLGDGIKRLAPSEAANYGRTNRSIHALHSLPAGTVISRENTALLRTEKMLRPGLGPEHWDSVIGRTLNQPVKSGEGIREEDLA